MASIIIPGRRAFLASIGAAAFFSTKGLFAEALTVTAETTEGPLQLCSDIGRHCLTQDSWQVQRS